MKSVKLTLTLVLLAVVGLITLAAFNWERLLSPAQKMRYGLSFSAAEDLRRAASGGDDPADLAAYVETLIANGNLGRAGYLIDLYGVESSEYSEIRTEIENSLKPAEAGADFQAISDSAAAEQFDGQPLQQSLLFLDGYRQALLGDWATARNYFMEVEERRLAPALRPYWQYYLARSYRLAGDEQQKASVEKLLLDVLSARPSADLSARARYNLIGYYLSPAYSGGQSPIALAKDQELLLGSSPEGWAVQKAYTDIGRYYLENGELAEAWPRAVAAITLNNDSESSAGAAELGLEILRGCAGGSIEGGRDSTGALTLELPEGFLLDLAQSCINRGDVKQALPVLEGLAKRLKDRPRWEELKVALARCYGKAGDRAALQRLMTEATLANFSDPATGRVLFALAELEEAQQQWNDALEHYRSCARLGGADAGQAWYGCYHIIKRVQDPMNLDSAEQYLQSAVAYGPADPAYGKAVEELIPLLIFSGKLTEASKLARQAAEDEDPPSGASAAEAEAHARLRSLGHSWLAYLAEKRGNDSAASEQRSQIPCQYWSYYELLNNYPPRPELEDAPAILRQPETAGEYFAGLGMTGAAEDYYNGTQDPGNQLLLHFRLANLAPATSLAGLAYEATELLESGRISEQALLESTLSLAYPRPFDEELLLAATRMRIDPALMYGIIKKESAFKVRNVSDQGAEGLMQVMPETAAFLNTSYGLGIDMARRREARSNLLLGAANLRMLFDQLGAGNVRGVIAGHNKGAGNYQKWQRLYPADEVLFTELIPNEENESFSKLVWKYYKIYEWLESNGDPAAD